MTRAMFTLTRVVRWRRSKTKSLLSKDAVGQCLDPSCCEREQNLGAYEAELDRSTVGPPPN